MGTPTSIMRASWATPMLESGSTWARSHRNSDLRNDYGEVHVPLQGDPVPTGQAKVGCFIGDHTRTGMGSMLNTGTAIGVMCNVLPAGILLPKHVPSFTAVSYGRVAPGFPLEKMFETARTVMGRRGKTFGEAEEQLLHDALRTDPPRARAGVSAQRRRAAATTGRSPRPHAVRPDEVWKSVLGPTSAADSDSPGQGGIGRHQSSRTGSA